MTHEQIAIVLAASIKERDILAVCMAREECVIPAWRDRFRSLDATIDRLYGELWKALA